jgi:hypothetical protein
MGRPASGAAVVRAKPPIVGACDEESEPAARTLHPPSIGVNSVDAQAAAMVARGEAPV